MGTQLTAEEILDEIEFELMQSVISSGEIGRATRSVRAYQQEVWSEITAHLSDFGDAGDSIRHLFRVNEMLITLVEQLVSDARVLKMEFRKLERLALSMPGRATLDTSDSADPLSQGPVDFRGDGDDDDDGSPELGTIIGISEMLDAVDQTPSSLATEVRSSHIPVFGTILNRMRMAVHSVAVFYVNRFALKQSRTNDAYRDLLKQLVDITAAQQEQIDVLRMKLRARDLR